MGNKKRAMAHIEMAISFGLFALFTFWLIVYLNPIRMQGINNVLIDTLERGVIANASVEVAEVPVNAVAAASCFKIKNPFDTSVRENMFVTDSNGNTLEFKFPDWQNISIKTSGNFYKLHYANIQFNVPPPVTDPCVALNLTQFNYTSTRMYSPLLISRLESMKWLYDNDYNSLKDGINFPKIADFNINITNLATQQLLIEMRRQKPKRVEVLAREIPVEIIQRNGVTIRAMMNLQVW